MKSIPILILCAVLTVLGAAGGWFAASQKSEGGPAAAGGHGHAHGPDGGHVDGGAGHGPAAAKSALSAQAIKNLGVTVKDAETETHYRYTSIPAVIHEAPIQLQPVFAPVAGTVVSIHVQPGAITQSGSAVVKIARDSLPRPSLRLTEQVIKPASEELHAAISSIRTATKNISLLKAEMERIRPFTSPTEGAPVLSKKTEIDLRNELARAEQESSNARETLSRQGYAPDQIKEFESGALVPSFNAQVWQRALKQSGFWPESADAVYAALPPELKGSPMTVAAIGELSASGISLADLAGWLKAESRASTHFMAIAGLLQEGSTLAKVQTLYASNALESIVELKAPDTAPDWDVQQIDVKAGQRVEAGTQIALLSNPRQMLLVTEPIGTETTALLEALKQGQELTATPQLKGGAAPLSGLKVSKVTGSPSGAAERSKGVMAYLRVSNEALTVRDEGANGQQRTWKFYAGQKYMLRVPTQKLADVFVLPSDALTTDGPDKIVFVQNGDRFESRKVVVLHQDNEITVLDSKSSDLFSGESVVQKGAFGLRLALKEGKGGQEEAGHPHPHPH